MKICESRSDCSTVDSLKSRNISISVIGLSGSSEVKGVVGVGKSSICNRLVRPDNFIQKQLSTLSSVDFYGDIINGSNWIYWDHIVETVDSKVYAFHIIEQTVLISDLTYQPFENVTELEYICRATSDKLVGSKRAYISPAQFSRSNEEDTTCRIDSKSNIDAFLLVFDVSEVNSRNYEAQEHYVIKMLTHLQKAKKPIIIALSKTDAKSQKIRSRFDIIVEKSSFKSIPIIETSAKLNINISLIPSIVIAEIQHHHRPLSLKIIKKSYKIQTYDELFAIREKDKEEVLIKFQNLVNEEVERAYDISWQDFVFRNDLSKVLTIIDKADLMSEYERCKMTMVAKINEYLMASYISLFKKLLFKFINPILSQDQSFNESIISKLLEDVQFLQHFQEDEASLTDFFRFCNNNKMVDYPLPRFLINVENPMNKLSLVESCFEEVKFQRIERNFGERFLASLESDPKLYEDMSFNDVDNKFKDQPTWSHFKEIAKSIFLEFIEKRIHQFKIIFDEKLLELSLMVFMCIPVKTCMRKCSIKEKDYKERLPDMELINSINNKIYFDHKRFDKTVYQKQRIKWVVKYIGSLISTNPCLCYHFNFNTSECQRNLLSYLRPFERFVQSVALVFSSDEVIDDYWNTLPDDKTIVIASDFSSSVEFISFNELSRENFWNRPINSCQKIIILSNGNLNDNSDILHRLHEEHISNMNQLSVVDVECYFTNSNLITSDIDIVDCIHQNILDVIKDQIKSYMYLTEIVYIWIIVLCDDTYDSAIPSSLILSLFDDCIILEQQIDTTMASVTIVYTPVNGDMPQRLRVTVLSYHQAFKLLNDDSQCYTLHLLLYFCDFNRLASINTMFAVLQNLFQIVNVKSVICGIKSSHFDDVEDFISRKNMLSRLALDVGASYILIENEMGIGTLCYLDPNESHQLRSIVAECIRLANCVDENKNLCKYNTAYENEESISTARTKIENYSWNKGRSKDRIRKELQTETINQNSSFGTRKRIISHSDYQIASNIVCTNQFFDDDQEKKLVDITVVESVPLGSFHEEMFLPIEEEHNFSKEAQDTSSIILIRCTNFKHIGSDDLLEDTRKYQHSSKFRSFSGPVQSNKSFSRKYSAVQNPFSRSQRYSSKKSQSLTTSPVTSSMKSYSQNQIMCTHCKGSNEFCICCHTTSTPVQNHIISTSKCIKNIFNRFFSSERSSTKSAEERRNIFSRSMRSSKKNSEKKNKNISNSSSEGIFNHSLHSTGSFILPPLHSTPLLVADTRSRTKSLTKTVFYN